MIGDLKALSSTFLKRRDISLLHTPLLDLDKRNAPPAIRTSSIPSYISAEEARYRAQFNALDTLLGSLRNTNGVLSEQIAVFAEENFPQ